MNETTIAYQVTNIVLRDEIYDNWEIFLKNLNSGPNTMKKELLNMWNSTKEKLNQHENLKIVDVDKIVSVESFDITMNITEDNVRVFYFIFPDAEIAIAQCKCVALALTAHIPRYFTMEYFSKENGNEQFMFGEWTLDNKHLNHGKLNNPTVDCFARNVQEKIKSI